MTFNMTFVDTAILERNISELRFIAFDTETTGISYEKDYVVELAAISFDEDFEHHRFSSLIRPPISIPEAVQKIHGISDEAVQGFPAADQILARFFSFLENAGAPRVLLAHNAAFDIGMILGECRRAGIDFPPEIVLDTCMMAKALLPNLEKHKLSALAEHFKISADGFHRALQDVLVLKAVFMKLLELAADKAAVGVEGMTLARLVDVCGGYFVFQRKTHLSTQKKLGENFYLPPRLKPLEDLCGTEEQIGISYENESDYRYVTPIRLEWKSFRVYMEAFCHRDQMKKRFRLDRVLKVGKILNT